MSLAGKRQVKTRSRTYPTLRVGGQLVNVKEKEFRRGKRQEGWSLSEREDNQRGVVSREKM